MDLSVTVGLRARSSYFVDIRSKIFEKSQYLFENLIILLMMSRPVIISIWLICCKLLNISIFYKNNVICYARLIFPTRYNMLRPFDFSHGAYLVLICACFVLIWCLLGADLELILCSSGLLLRERIPKIGSHSWKLNNCFH